MLSSKARIPILVVLIIVTLACVPLLSPSVSTPVPTLAPGELEVIIAQTAAMAASQTVTLMPPTLTPTLTPSPTVTASVTPSPTATFIFLLPTLTNSPGGTGISGPLNQGFSCTIISTDPPLNGAISAGASFDAHWIVQNNGTELWDSANMDYSHASGPKIYVGEKARDFDISIAPGEILDIVIEMKAPKASGVYTIVWKLRSGQEYFCPMTIRISV